MRSQATLPDKPVGMLQFLDGVQRTVRAVVPDAEIILYGSRARGDARSASDWDFLILVDQSLSRNMIKTLRHRLYDLELETDRIISSIIRTKAEWNSPQYAVMPFRTEIEREGVLL